MKRCEDLLRDRRGGTALEFAIVASAFLACLMFLIGSGIVLWAKAAVYDAAFRTARCSALGSTDCPDVQTYAMFILGNWGAASLLSTVTVTLQSSVSCSNTAGKFSSVAITGSVNTGTSLDGTQITAVACFPSGA